MATVFCVTNCLPGMLYSSVELCRRLQAAGHRVVYGGAERARATVELQGLESITLEDSGYADFLEADSKKGLAERWSGLRERRREAVESLRLGGFEAAIDELNPDLLLIDAELLEHIFVALGMGRRVALLNSFASIWRTPGLPPPHRLAVPGGGWKGSSSWADLLWQELRVSKARRAATLWRTRAGCDRVSVLKELARQRGVSFSAVADTGQWLRPFHCRGLPVLSLHALELEFPHTPPADARYVGPMLLRRRGDAPLDEADRSRLEAVFARRRESGGRRKLIYAAFGSFFTSDRGFLRRLFEAVRERENWELVVALGGRVDPAELGELPERVHAFGWVPQLEALEHADVAVVHGGVNSTDECVLHDVPMLVYCGYKTDMAGVTSRVIFHEIGLAGDPGRDDGAAIRGRLDRLLTEPGFRENVARLRQSFERYERERVAEATVDELLASAK